MTHDPVMYSRILTGLTLGFHIIFATIGVGVPLLIAIAEWIGIRRRDPHYVLMARRWTKGFVVTVAVGVVTGTSIGMQLNMLWPTFMQVAGQAVALPLFMETFAFFVEAIFLGIYLYTWNRFNNPWLHWLLSIPVVIGSSCSALFITAVNAFMNTPQGFRLEGSHIVDLDPIAAMLNPSMPTKSAHVLATSYMTCAFILAGIAAFALFKKIGGAEGLAYSRKALKLTMTCALLFSLTSVVIGDLSGKFLAKHQPEKLAAAEWHFETASKAPLVLGGILGDDGKIRYGIKIPYALSILAGDRPNAVVKGLNDIPADERPPLFVHYFFDGMVAIGTGLTALSAFYVFAAWRKKRFRHHPIVLLAILFSGPLAMLAVELGWIFAEAGRQPWILRGYMKTVEGATTSDQVGSMLVLFSALYLVLAVSSVLVLRRIFRKNPIESDLEKLHNDRDIQQGVTA